MRRHRPAIATAVLLAWLTGCATSALKMAPERPDQPWATATNAEGEIIAGKKGAAEPKGGYVLPANKRLDAVPSPPAIDREKFYSLADLVDLAESSNPVTRIAWNEARKVALATGIAESTYLPRLTASAVGAYEIGTAQQSVPGGSVTIDNTAHGAVVALSFEWLVFDFGKRGAIVEAAKQASVISNISFTAAHQQVIYSVTLAYYAHAAARARTATATQALRNAEVVQAAAEDRRAHEVGTIIEVAQARQATAQANLAVVQATGATEDSYLALVSALGISPLTRLHIADVSDRVLSPAMAPSVESIIADSLARRPDVLSAYAAQKASVANLRAAKAEFFPKFFVAATGAYNSATLNLTGLPSVGEIGPTFNITTSLWSAIFLAGVRLPIYDGGTRAAALEQARADADSADARLTHVREEAVRQIAVADNALRTSLSAYSAAEALAAATQTTFDAALAAYRSGVGSITELTLAETQLLQARNVRTDAYSTALSAAATLGLAVGTLGTTPP